MSAGADRVELFNCVDECMGNLGFRIRAEIFCTFCVFFTGEKYTWKNLLCDTNPWVGFVICEQAVVSRLEVLDKTVLQIESLVLAVNYYVLEVANVANKQVGAYDGMHAVEIGAYATFEVLGFAHIDDNIVPV